MLRSFFLDKFEFDFQVNRTWIEHLLQQEDHLNDFIRKQISHLINVHHIWLARVSGTTVESSSWDDLPSHYWIRLNEDNYRKTEEYLLHFDYGEKINYHDEEGVPMEKVAIDILYHVLQHSQYHRAQIARELRYLELPVPSLHFISYR